MAFYHKLSMLKEINMRVLKTILLFIPYTVYLLFCKIFHKKKAPLGTTMPTTVQINNGRLRTVTSVLTTPLMRT